ncbi:hypothetical protein AYI68_g5612 [Smittium mucronatum]|uniref:Uncharacterized protein n=1 Tax=Smittium mucronatum TaxID=133383 RepID=A0A1R0GTS0_9FUNG|nr:hypothetical protein AYI68_g5612 [Smittium mucronatum]
MKLNCQSYFVALPPYPYYAPGSCFPPSHCFCLILVSNTQQSTRNTQPFTTLCNAAQFQPYLFKQIT